MTECLSTKCSEASADHRIWGCIERPPYVYLYILTTFRFSTPIRWSKSQNVINLFVCLLFKTNYSRVAYIYNSPLPPMICLGNFWLYIFIVLVTTHIRQQPVRMCAQYLKGLIGLTKKNVSPIGVQNKIKWIHLPPSLSIITSIGIVIGII